MIPSRANENAQIETLRARLAATEDQLQAMLHGGTSDAFLGLLAHELRDSLCAICNAVGVIEVTHARGERAARAHAVIARQVSHVSRLIEDLLDVDRLVSGTLRLQRQPLDVAEAVPTPVVDARPVSGGGGARSPGPPQALGISS